jgi:hypothetical protein
MLNTGYANGLSWLHCQSKHMDGAFVMYYTAFRLSAVTPGATIRLLPVLVTQGCTPHV